MNVRNLVAAFTLAAMPLAAAAATIVVPAAGTGPGASNSQWQSELTLHSAAPRAVDVSVAFHQGTTVLGPIAVHLPARGTVSIPDVAKTAFGLASGTGALVIEASDRDAKSLAVTSRTFNTSTEGEFGQDIAAFNVTAAARAGEIAAVNGPSSVQGNRLNFGIYAVSAARVTWEVVRADGSVAGAKSAEYSAGQHAQFGSGIETLLAVTPRDGDTVYARITEGSAIVYGSIVNATGDPTFVPGIRTRDDIVILFNGLDLDEDGTVDVPDADGDSVLDAPLTIETSLYPSFTRVVAVGEFGELVTFELVSTPAFTKLDADGLLQIAAFGDVKGKSGEITIRATSGNSSTILTIPVLFR